MVLIAGDQCARTGVRLDFRHVKLRGRRGSNPWAHPLVL